MVSYSSYMHHKEGENTERYYPKNKEKVFPKGKEFFITRSSWEKKFCYWCDVNPSVILWSSEPIGIPYYNPIKIREANYYPDFLIKVLDKTKKTEKVWLVEVKPYKECMPPKIGKKKQKTIIHENVTWQQNQAKWKAAMDYCKRKGWSFKLITEKELGL